MQVLYLHLMTSILNLVFLPCNMSTNHTPDYESYEPEVGTHTVRRVSKQPIPQEKHMVQPLIQPMVKKMRMSGKEYKVSVPITDSVDSGTATMVVDFCIRQNFYKKM